MKMGKTVTIYVVTCTKGIPADAQGTGYSLLPWGDDTAHIQGYDDGGRAYLLPDGLTVAESVDGQLYVYSRKDPCHLGGNPKTSTPWLQLPDGNKVWLQPPGLPPT